MTEKRPEFIGETQPIEVVAQIPLLIVVDRAISNVPSITAALEMQRADYLHGTDGLCETTWEFGSADFTDVPWEDRYDGIAGHFGIDRGWLRQDTSWRLRSYFSIAYVIHPDNWKAPKIGGWSVGFFNGLHVQLIQGYGKAYLLYLTFAMELAHVWNDIFPGLEALFDVSNFDDDVIHGEDPRYPVNISYVKIIKVLKDLLVKRFALKDMLTKEQVAMLYRLVWHRDPDTQADGYVGKDLSFVLNEFYKSKEFLPYDGLHKAAKVIENKAKNGEL